MKMVAAMLLPQSPGEPTSESGDVQSSSSLMASQASAQPAEVQI